MADEKENCSICFEELGDEKKEEYKLSCNHVYHRDCIAQWLSNNTTCPLCRANVDPIDQYVEDDIVSPDRMRDIRDEIAQMRAIAEFGAYGLEGLATMVTGKGFGLGNHIGQCARSGVFDSGFELIARKESGGWWVVAITVVLAIATHFMGNRE